MARCACIWPCFDPRSRVGSDALVIVPVQVPEAFRSTLPRGERRRWRISSACRHVSIHAPAWGATMDSLRRRGVGISFRSTLPRGERRFAPPGFFMLPSFDPRSRVGSDPSRGRVARLLGGFDPRSRVGSDNQGGRRNGSLTKFRSTLPRGERRPVTVPMAAPSTFRSTLPRGERPRAMSRGSTCWRFRSTLPRGERRHF